MLKKDSETSRKLLYLCTVETDFRERNVKGLNLHLTTRFSDDVLTFGPVRIRVALSRAYLNFQLENCDLPLANDLDRTWARQEKTRVTVKKRSSRKEYGGDKVDLTASANPSMKWGSATKGSISSAIETKSETNATWRHVFWRGGIEGPSLVFDSQPSHKFLSGTLLSSEFVGSVEPKECRFYRISLELEIPKSGLMLEDGDEFKSYPNKRGLIKLIAALALCRQPMHLHEHRLQR